MLDHISPCNKIYPKEKPLHSKINNKFLTDPMQQAYVALLIESHVNIPVAFLKDS